jgi:outer membrane lipoprotein SlyB
MSWVTDLPVFQGHPADLLHVGRRRLARLLIARPTALALIASALVLAMLSGCATQPRLGDHYRRSEALREQTVRVAVVESVRDVVLDRERSGVGTLAGAAIGGVAGSSIGKGNGSTIGAIGGSVLGGVIGQAIEDSTARVPAVEITVRLADGTLVAIVQEAGSTRLRVGDAVRLLSNRGVTRIVPA